MAKSETSVGDPIIPISDDKKYSSGDILESFIETNFFLKANCQGFQKNSVSNLKTSSSCCNDVMITSHLQNKENQFFTFIYVRKFSFGMFQVVILN